MSVQYEIVSAELTPDHRRIEPQPDMMPFRISFSNRGPEYWYNERRRFRQCGRGPMLMSWKCPFGEAGKPVRIDGVFYWEPTGEHLLQQ